MLIKANHDIVKHISQAFQMPLYTDNRRERYDNNSHPLFFYPGEEQGIQNLFIHPSASQANPALRSLSSVLPSAMPERALPFPL